MRIYKLKTALVPILVMPLLIAGCTSTTMSTGSALLDGDGWISEKSYYQKKVHYGTTRVDKCIERHDSIAGAITTQINQYCLRDVTRLNTGNKYTNKEIQYGTATVKIPFTKEIGGIEGMSITKLEHDIGFTPFISKLTSDDLLVFVHGFNTSFTNAAIRTAQLAHDTNFKGEAVFFSWPSSENPATYSTDKKRAKDNFKFLAEFLIKLSENTDKQIHIVAHSMGTYLLVNSLSIINEEIDGNDNLLKSRRLKNNNKIFNQIILAAPDISMDEYHHKFNRYSLSKVARKITLYSSINDHVLSKASRFMNYFIEGTGQARLGDSSAGFFVVDGMDTVDTRQEISAQFFGHSFYANYRGLVTDIYLLLNHGTDPNDRMLQRVIDEKNNTLWLIRD
ncbi:hypothetical protein PSECIP111951_03134 [Pseudoalteromonas holothuriae]|uniref:Alpha/beta hydrolase n=2 Tax=Pseudoalteromonas holothuriae TaxID=2963714 RepID=A0A9W4VPI1_9GAMM|nr:alpha/beta fold hydrolase [Pseudoalteromonas sp. CIP111854]CAH9053963.1 hypothetical protein PSECIP111854_01273 [Pseudoalteromonas sp. CIP111854]CAH9064452.1 hypothetical protein PSECIP111951_03134 [Pseudoalteromonas sp. CIP111951]